MGGKKQEYVIAICFIAVAAAFMFGLIAWAWARMIREEHAMLTEKKSQRSKLPPRRSEDVQRAMSVDNGEPIQFNQIGVVIDSFRRPMNSSRTSRSDGSLSLAERTAARKRAFGSSVASVDTQNPMHSSSESSHPGGRHAPAEPVAADGTEADRRAALSRTPAAGAAPPSSSSSSSAAATPEGAVPAPPLVSVAPGAVAECRARATALCGAAGGGGVPAGQVAMLASDACVARFVFAWEGDVASAAGGLVATMRWREKAGLFDDPSRLTCPVDHGRFCFFPVGCDVDGHVVLYSCYGRAEPPTAANCHATFDHACRVLEEALAPDEAVAAGQAARSQADLLGGSAHARCGALLPAPSRVVWILDFNGFGFKHVNRAHVRHGVGIFQDHYPCRLSEIVLLKPPFAFSSLWYVLKPMMDQNTVRLVRFLTTDAEVNAYLDRRLPPPPPPPPAPPALAPLAPAPSDPKAQPAKAAQGGTACTLTWLKAVLATKPSGPGARDRYPPGTRLDLLGRTKWFGPPTARTAEVADAAYAAAAEAGHALPTGRGGGERRGVVGGKDGGGGGGGGGGDDDVGRGSRSALARAVGSAQSSGPSSSSSSSSAERGLPSVDLRVSPERVEVLPRGGGTTAETAQARAQARQSSSGASDASGAPSLFSRRAPPPAEEGGSDAVARLADKYGIGGGGGGGARRHDSDDRGSSSSLRESKRRSSTQRVSFAEGTKAGATTRVSHSDFSF